MNQVYVALALSLTLLVHGAARSADDFPSYGREAQPPQREKLHPNLIPVVTVTALASSFQRRDDWNGDAGSK